MSKYTLAVFDLDGTVLDTLDDLTSSVNFALNEGGFPQRSRDEIKGFVGNGIRKLVDRALPRGVPEEAADRVFASFKAYYAIHNADRTHPYCGIIPLVTALRKRGMYTALVSNKADFAVKSLAERYFDGLFDIAVGEKEGVPRKPDPASVNEVLRLLSVSKENAVYIGDSDVDILTAKNADIDCVSVTWGFRSREFLKNNGAAVLADTADELYAVITGE